MKERFSASRESPGSRTMMKHLRAEGFEIGRGRTRRFMKALNPTVEPKRKYKVNDYSVHRTGPLLVESVESETAGRFLPVFSVNPHVV